jgi:hypothetical protein
MNDEGEFLNFDLKSWTTSDGQFFIGTRPNAIRVARKLCHGTTFIVTNYGFADQVKEEVLPNGDVVPVDEGRDEFVPLTREDAKIRGLIVDDTCYPWFAYKGPRFGPTENHDCLTDLEAKLFEVVNEVAKFRNCEDAADWKDAIGRLTSMAEEAVEATKKGGRFL